MRFQYREEVSFYFIFTLIVVMICVTCGGCIQPAEESMMKKTLRATFYDQAVIVGLLATYRMAMETENINLFSSCFDRGFQNSNHNNLESLKEETKRFFLAHNEIKVNFDNVDLEIRVPGDPKAITKAEAQAKIDGGLKHQPIQVNTKFSIESPNNIKEPEATLSFLCEIHALIVRDKDLPEKICYKEKKCFYLREKRGEWKIYRGN